MKQNSAIDKPAKRSKKKLVFSIIFGIPALLLASACASFVSIMSLFGFSVVFTEKGIVPMAVCLISAYLNALPGILLSVLSQKVGKVTALNKVSLALSIACCVAGTLIFITLALAVLAEKIGM